MRLLMLPSFDDLVPWLIGGVVLGSLSFGVVQSFRLIESRAALAQAQREHAAALAELERAARQQVQHMRDTENEWKAAQHENAVLAEKAHQQARADAAAADAAAGRLRDRFAALAAGCHPAAPDPAAVTPGAAPSAPADLLADVLGRMDEAARRIAAYADAAGISGEQCAADYQTLKPR